MNDRFSRFWQQVFLGAAPQPPSAEDFAPTTSNSDQRKQLKSRQSAAQTTQRARRAAYAQPQVLAACLVALVVGASCWAMAQKSDSDPAQNKTAPLAQKPERAVVNWDKLPQMMAEYGQRRATQAALRGTGSGKRGFSARQFPLTEVDLTPNTLSDEREPTYRPPTSGFIAFSSNGIDANGDGILDPTGFSVDRKYHIWIMRRDGSGMQQVTGLGADRARDQRSATWSPDGNRLAYYDVVSPTVTQLSIVSNFIGQTATTPTQITFFPGQKLDPAWSPDGGSIAFASNVAPGRNNDATPNVGNRFDIFTIGVAGSALSVRRLTGDADGRPASAPTPDDPQDLDGNLTDDRHPAYSQLNPGIMFFSSNRDVLVKGTATQTRVLARGRRIFAMNSITGQFKRQITDPVARGGSADDTDDYPSASNRGFFNVAQDFRLFNEKLAFQSTNRIDASDTFNDLNIWSLGIETRSTALFLSPPNLPRPTFEGSAQNPVPARVESNLLSSPNAIRGGFSGITQDQSADREPSFSRSNDSGATIAPIAFASQRQRGGAPSNNAQKPVVPVVNPGGGVGDAATHDIWITQAQDFTPPLLVPVSVGNQQIPFVAPGRQAPFFAPRTFEEGLAPGGKLIIAAVISEKETGLNTGAPTGTPTAAPTQTPVDPTATATPFPLVDAPPTPFTGTSATVSIRDADMPSFNSFTSKVGDGVRVQTAVEQKPQVVVGDLPMAVYDDGPPRMENGVRVGNERQANAIAGDGLYYVQGSFEAKDATGADLDGDFFIDLTVTDKNGNEFTYDQVYGFSTRPFRKQASLLFVADYTSGQTFPTFLTNGFNASGRTGVGALGTDGGLPSVESYHLANPGGFVFIKDDEPPLEPEDMINPRNGAADITTFSPPGSATFGIANTSTDIWRILSRGPVPTSVMRLYAPQIAQQIDPKAPAFPFRVDGVFNATPTPVPDDTVVVVNPTPTVTPVPGTIPTDPLIPVTVAQSAIVWAAPYTGGVFAAPGTIFDVQTQTDLKQFLSLGGRLFMNGQDIIFALSNAGTISNSFLSDELKVNWGGETGAADVLRGKNYGYTIEGTGDGPIVNRNFFRRGNQDPDPPKTLHVPFNPEPRNDPTNTYFDASDNDAFADVIAPVDGDDDTTITALYNYSNGEGRGAQRIEHRNRTNGAESRVIFFGFGLEHINREYSNAEKLRYARNYRAKIADNIVNFLRTGSISGRVTNAATNLPIPNFLVQIADGGLNNRLFLTRTDRNGFYEIVGIPAGDGAYRISPAAYLDTRAGVFRSLNPGYFYNQNIPTILTVLGGESQNGVDFRVNPAPPSTISGRAISDKGSPNDLTDDTVPSVDVAPNLPVLLRSIDANIPPSTNFPAGGPFAILTQTDAFGNFSFSNVLADLRIEIVFNPRVGLVSQGGDIPDGSGIDYGTPTAQIQPNPNFGRRVIPADANLNAAQPANVPNGDFLLVPTGTSLNIGDIPIPGAGSGISGRVRRAGVGVADATVQLANGTGTLQSATTDANGVYTFRDVQPGSYTITATITIRGQRFGGSVRVNVPAGRNNLTAPDINIVVGGGGGGTPGTTPTPGPTIDTYTAGNTYQITIPFSDSAAVSATTTVTKAFTKLEDANGAPIFSLFRFDAMKQTYMQLNVNSQLKRGEGYFLRVLSGGTSLREPPTFRDRFVTPVTEFTITLNLDPSRRDANNGYNNIGSPFDPRFGNVDWYRSRVIAPDGRVFNSIQEAAGAGLISAEPPVTLNDDGSGQYVPSNVLRPRKGYFVRTFVNNLRVVLRVR